MSSEQSSNGTGQHKAVGYVGPEEDDTEPIGVRYSWYEKMLGRVSKPVPEKKETDAVPTHLVKTKQVIDFAKYVVTALVFLVGLGWMGREYIGQFQTDDEAAAAQQSNTEAHTQMQTSIDAQSESLDNMGVYNVRIELEQRSTTDRLGQLLELQTAETRAERREAMGVVDELQDQIDRRERIIRSPAALKRISERVREDPLRGLEDL